MKLKYTYLKPYYTFKTAIPKTNINVGYNIETQEMKYNYIDEKIKRYKKVEKTGNISLWLIMKYWRFYRDCIKEAVSYKYNVNVIDWKVMQKDNPMKTHTSKELRKKKRINSHHPFSIGATNRNYIFCWWCGEVNVRKICSKQKN